MKYFLLIITLSSIFIFASSFEQAKKPVRITKVSPDTCMRAKANPVCRMQNLEKASTKLQQNEMDGLCYMREEEKLAFDTYSHFAGLYAIPIFNNISRSEQMHMDAILILLNAYSIPDPAAKTEKGEYKNSQLSALYKNLTQAGETDIVSALKAGALIEETDIADLKKHLSETENSDIIATYTQLLEASYRHLRAFTKNLSFRQHEYIPQVLSQSDYDLIIAK